jgi:hypothetical protein
MTGQPRKPAAQGIWLLGLGLTVAGLLFARLGTSGASPMTLLIGLSQGTALVAVGLVGLLIAVRQPRNAIGWLYLAFWVATGLLSLSTGYGHWATVAHDGAVAGEFAVWLHNWLWVPLLSLLLFPFLLFPNGHVPSPRWRSVAWWVAISCAAWSVAFAFEGHDYSDAEGLHAQNPYTPSSLVPLFDALRNVFAVAFLIGLVLCLVSLYVRFRRADGMARAQIKWLFLAGGVTLAFLLLPGDHGSGGGIDVAMGFALASIPLAVGVAILRYHLYDIDRVISRTLSYLIVTALLVGVYSALVLGVTGLVGSDAPWVVAAATLTAAALAQPLYRRVQALIDRRFDRTRYDQLRTVDVFGQTLRRHVRTEDVSEQLLSTVHSTLHPNQASLWMRNPS